MTYDSLGSALRIVGQGNNIFIQSSQHTIQNYTIYWMCLINC